MDHSSVFGSIFIILSLLVRSSLSVDNQFEACVPKKCGDNLSISFPFWISGEHESYCGHPFFGINCTNNEPILSISNDQYIVRNIFHTNQSVLVSGTNELKDDCPIPRRNLTQFSTPFTLSSNNMNLYFFYNCTSNPVYPTHQIPCAINKTTRHHSFFVYVHDEEGLGTMTAYEETCDSVVKSAVDDEGMSYRAFVEADYLETLRRGFLLEWGPSNCTGCEASGGHCGFKNGEFICFCRDKPYSKVCNNDTAVSVDSQFEACKPWDCGKGPKISYPFWVAGEQQSYCGYPNSSFQLSCIDDEPIINLSDVEYIIREISYSEKSLSVYKRKSSNNICSSGIKNITINGSLFVYGPAHVDVFVFSACKTPFPTEYLQYLVRCTNSDPAHHSLALFSNDTRLNDVVTSRICETSVIIPVDIIGNSSWSTVPSNELIVEGLKDGFNLRWNKVSDCNVCQRSGGRCGFDFVEYKVMCFCPDRPHHKECHHSIQRVQSQETVKPLDPQFKACVPHTCGNGLNISYPFYILGVHEDYCGYPGFGVRCVYSKPVLRMSSSNYIVIDIFYKNQSFLVVDSDAMYNSCPSPRHNFSFERGPFHFGPNVVELSFFYNCTSLYPDPNAIYHLNCFTSTFLYSFAMLFPLGTLDDSVSSSLKCENFVGAPVEMEGRLASEAMEQRDYLLFMKNGFVVTWTESNCDDCEGSGGRCGQVNQEFTCFCPYKPHSRSCKEGSKKMKNVIIGVGAGAGVLLLACVFFLIRLRRKKHQSKSSALISRSLTPDSSIKPDLERGTSSYFQTPIFSYAELQEATDNFDSSKEIGDGGFGTVYHGTLRDGRVVAVKRLYENNYKRHDQFMNELEILSRLRHRNLVTLYGCTTRHSRELLLVYEYIPNGTVADNLHGDRASTSPLTWPVRLSVAIETADALSYLHASDIIHRDVKTNNILLDHNFHVKVADFGLSRLFPMNATHVSTAPQGTPGYVDPEYYQCYQLNDKSDVYSFGVVLIELISSKPAVDIGRHRHEINLSNMAINKIHNDALHELVDPSLGFESDYSVRRMITMVAELAFRCLQQEKDMRPGMMEVLKCLKDIESVEKVEKAEEVDIPADARLLKNVPPFSPTSVTDKWVSSTTTPNTSG